MLASCDGGFTRRVTVTVPTHEWEIYNTGARLWYTLSWTDGHDTQSLRLDEDTRTATIDVRRGSTVLACAYPLGDMDPFGCAIQPDDPSTEYLMTSEDGVLCAMLIDCDRDVTSGLNYRALREAVDEVCADILCLDSVSLCRDMLNGCLRRSSIVTLPRVEVSLQSFPGGVWTSSRSGGGRLVVSTGQTVVLSLPPGVSVWWCRELGLEMRVAVDTDGRWFSYVRQARLE